MWGYSLTSDMKHRRFRIKGSFNYAFAAWILRIDGTGWKILTCPGPKGFSHPHVWFTWHGYWQWKKQRKSQKDIFQHEISRKIIIYCLAGRRNSNSQHTRHDCDQTTVARYKCKRIYRRRHFWLRVKTEDCEVPWTSWNRHWLQLQFRQDVTMSRSPVDSEAMWVEIGDIDSMKEWSPLFFSPLRLFPPPMSVCRFFAIKSLLSSVLVSWDKEKEKVRPPLCKAKEGSKQYGGRNVLVGGHEASHPMNSQGLWKNFI